jgi:predicted nucleotidyltransferase
MPDPIEFSPEEMLRTLVDHDVRFVLIGGYAAVLHGSAAFTTDADICPARTPENLQRLAAAIRDMDGRIRSSSDTDGLDFACDEHFLGQMVRVNLITRYGAFDISFKPAALDNYDQLEANAVDYEIAGVVVKVASLRDIIRSKETANRPKDLQVLPHLRALQDEIAKQEHR